MKRKIYVASSWRNPLQPAIIDTLIAHGHKVYDFRHPKPDDNGFSWGDIAEGWLGWSLDEYIEGIKHPIAKAGFASDKEALDWCDMCVLVLPCGRSAHLEAGYAIGQGKPTIILLHENKFEPELMYLLAGHTRIVPDIDGMLAAIAQEGQP